MSDDETPRRIAELEATFERLSGELATARAALHELRGDRMTPPADPMPSTAESQAPPAGDASPLLPPPLPPPLPPLPRPAPRSSAPRVALDAGSGDLERFVGRYGALALGALTVVMGIGALVSWAIKNDMLGPRTRVSLGALLTAALAGIGWRLRARSPRYGNTLLALAVALLQVVAWGAGPALGLVSPTVALEVADVGSLLLAALALREGSESLFVVGFGSALIAPFVMRTGEPRLLLLGAYGLVILAGALRAMRGHAWRLGTALCVVGTALYAIAISGYTGDVVWLHRIVGAVFALVVAVLSLQWPREPDRPAIGMVAVGLAALLCLDGANALVTTTVAALAAEPVRLFVHVAGALIALAVARSVAGSRADPGWLSATIVLPMLFVNDAFNPLPAHREVSAALRLVWAAMYVQAAWLERGERRNALVAWCGVLTAWSIALVVHGSARPVALAAHAVLAAAIATRLRLRGALVPSALSIVVAYALAISAIIERGYSQVPLLRVPSLVAALVIASAYVAVRLGASDVEAWHGESWSKRDVAIAVSAFGAFWWGAVEMSLAFNRDRSTFLLVLYLAACGVTLIARGRARRAERLRQLGLALAVCAALYALLASSAVEQIGLRVGSYLAVGAFLLGVAWWYRADVA